MKKDMKELNDKVEILEQNRMQDIGGGEDKEGREGKDMMDRIKKMEKNLEDRERKKEKKSNNK